MIIQKVCIECNAIHDINMTPEQYAEIQIPLRQRTRFIQDILPSPQYTSDQRELFQTGLCGKCFDKLWLSLED